MKKMQTEVISRQSEENEIVTNKLCSSREDGVNKMYSSEDDHTC